MEIKMTRQIILGILLLAVLIIGGCGGGSSSGPVLNTEFRSGTEGLKVTFINNMPTDRVYAGELFNIGLNLENAGAHSIGKGIITISGYERDQYSFEGGNQQEFQLRGRSQYEPKGEVLPLVFTVNSLCYPAMARQMITNLTTAFRATACYTYSSIANAQVCIDTNPLASQIADKKACQVKSVTLSGGQGGPVAVTKVDSSMIPIGNGVKARFIIHLENLNKKGTVYSPGAVESNCETPEQQYRIIFGASLADVPMYCQPDGEIQLNLGAETVVSCEIDLNKEGGVYETQLTVGLEYAYSQDAVKVIHVEKPVNVDIPACT